jgi:hypothetical protein
MILILRRQRAGIIEYINEKNEIVKREVPAARGDYGGVYDALYETIVNGAPGYVSETDIITNLEILERGFEHASPSIITLDY